MAAAYTGNEMSAGCQMLRQGDGAARRQRGREADVKETSAGKGGIKNRHAQGRIMDAGRSGGPCCCGCHGATAVMVAPPLPLGAAGSGGSSQGWSGGGGLGVCVACT